eukprot:gene5952-6895_t
MARAEMAGGQRYFSNSNRSPTPASVLSPPSKLTQQRNNKPGQMLLLGAQTTPSPTPPPPTCLEAHYMQFATCTGMTSVALNNSDWGTFVYKNYADSYRMDLNIVDQLQINQTSGCAYIPYVVNSGVYYDTFINYTIETLKTQPTNITGVCMRMIATEMCSKMFTPVYYANALCDECDTLWKSCNTTYTNGYIPLPLPSEDVVFNMLTPLAECKVNTIAENLPGQKCWVINPSIDATNWFWLYEAPSGFEIHPGGVLRGSLLGFGLLVSFLLMIGVKFQESGCALSKSNVVINAPVGYATPRHNDEPITLSAVLDLFLTKEMMDLLLTMANKTLGDRPAMLAEMYAFMVIKLLFDLGSNRDESHFTADFPIDSARYDAIMQALQATNTEIASLAECLSEHSLANVANVSVCAINETTYRMVATKAETKEYDRLFDSVPLVIDEMNPGRAGLVSYNTGTYLHATTRQQQYPYLVDFNPRLDATLEPESAIEHLMARFIARGTKFHILADSAFNTPAALEHCRQLGWDATFSSGGRGDMEDLLRDFLKQNNDGHPVEGKWLAIAQGSWILSSRSYFRHKCRGPKQVYHVVNTTGFHFDTPPLVPASESEDERDKLVHLYNSIGETTRAPESPAHTTYSAWSRVITQHNACLGRSGLYRGISHWRSFFVLSLISSYFVNVYSYYLTLHDTHITSVSFRKQLIAALSSRANLTAAFIARHNLDVIDTKEDDDKDDVIIKQEIDVQDAVIPPTKLERPVKKQKST